MHDNHYDLLYSMGRRSAENMIQSIFGVDVTTHPIGKMLWENQLKKHDPIIRGYLESFLSEPPSSIDAGRDIIKEEISTRIDNFAEKIKQKIEEKNKNQE